MSNPNHQAVFQTPFSRLYWRLAVGELKSVRILVLAALITALRIAVKALAIPVGPSLKITIGFFFNALGAMIYGPVVGLLTGAASDTIGCLLFSHGEPYFFPFIFSEMMGSFLFALFLYRSKVTPTRVILSRFAVTVGCNLILDPLLLYWQYALMGKGYTLLSMPRIIKNVALFPIQCLLLILFLGLMLPITERFGLTHTGKANLKITKRHVVLLVILTVLSIAAVILYAIYLANK